MVLVGGAPTVKPARLVAPGEPVELLGEGPRFVSRGGDKLDAAIHHFEIDVSGRRALDAGARAVRVDAQVRSSHVSRAQARTEGAAAARVRPTGRRANHV